MSELVQLRCFAVLAEECHFGRAAARLNMTQPPLSRHITQLEHRLGVALFTRSTRAVRLTTAGAALLPEVRRILTLMQGMQDSARRLAHGEGGVVAVGVTSGASTALLPLVVAAAGPALPGVRLTLHELGTEEQMAGLAAGALDLGIVRPPETREGVELVTIRREGLRLAVPARHRLARARQPVEAEALRDETFLMYAAQENRYFHDVVMAAMRQAGLIPARTRSLRAVHAILALVAVGAGIAIVPESAEGLGVRGAVLRRLGAGFTATIDHCLAWRADNPNPALARLLPVVRAAFGV